MGRPQNSIRKLEPYKLKLDVEKLREIKLLKQLNIYWSNEYKTLLDKDFPSSTFVCEYIMIEGLEEQFIVKGVIEDYGSKKDEVFGIMLLKRSLKEVAGLNFYKSLTNENNLDIEILITNEEFYDNNVKKIVNIEVDQGIIFNNSLYIGRYNYPNSLIISDNKDFINTVKDAAAHGVKIGKGR